MVNEVVIDTNFFMAIFQFKIDILDELKKVVPSYKLTTPKFVISELEGLKTNKNQNIRKQAAMALKIAKSGDVEIMDVSTLNGESVDDALLRISKSKILATNDSQLKKRAKEASIQVAYIRQKRYVAID
ncbi:PIN domain-containing protein [uncultured Methanobrevibacter sp.]|uniref:type II toxin-antitoxin system VapC family toxin n=1 Tax=uncultured Methanobrevibacter sp. TaxID=253161 RepID=UPI0025F53C55|nr:PIN domain-containing protein [uncultured Methanobrevibacter sp.]